MIRVTNESLSAPLRRPWKKGIAVGRAYDLLRADLLDHLRWLQKEIGFYSCRFHAVFHDDMAVVKRRSDGSIVYQWHHLDKVYDALLDMGLKPFVELNPMPAALASGSQTMFQYKMNVTPPRLWSEWHDLVQAFGLHCVERYGLEEVRDWHFEVWNEPNLAGFWSGTKQDYFRLYSHAAHALKSVDSYLRVGGPATSKAHWLNDFLEYCDKEAVPLDFLSTHLYPQDEFVEYANRESSPHAPGAFFGDIVRSVKRQMLDGKKTDLPIHWTEWNTQLATSSKDVTWLDNRYVDSLHGASFVARQMTELDNEADNFTYWVASDLFEESPQPNTPFSGTYGLLTVHGLPKATGNAFRFLECLRGPRLEFSPGRQLPEHCGGVATLEGRSIRVLLWNDIPPGMEATEWDDALQLVLSPPISADSWLLTSRQIKAGSGSCCETWETMGRPVNLTEQQMAVLAAQSEPASRVEILSPDEKGVLQTAFRLLANEVLLMEFSPSGPSAQPKGNLLASDENEFLEQAMGDQSRE